jgi:hypothetical protein
LKQTAVTDAGLVHLRRLSELMLLDITKTRITPAGTGALKKQLPRLVLHGAPAENSPSIQSEPTAER